MVDLIAEPAEGYRFVWWTGDVGTIAEVSASSTAIFINGDCVINANFAPIASHGLPLFSPADGSKAVRITNIGFTWGSLPDAKTYRWVLSKNPDLSAPVETMVGLTMTAYLCTKRLDYDTRYYWKVTAWDNGVMLEESGIGTFTTTDGW